VTKAEDLIRSTTRAVASTVRDVPPLHLDPAGDELQGPAHGLPLTRRPHASVWPGRWRAWLGPVIAVVAVIAVALALVIVKHTPNDSAPPPITHKTAALPDGVPRYYVAWMQADRPYLVVGNTATGARIAEVMSPSGVSLESVFGGAADDRTFIVTGDRPHGVTAGTQWYQLRLTPGGKTPARLTPLPVPVRQAPAGVAISPDGRKLAVALPGTPAVLRVYSMATGALLRTWSAPAGRIMAIKAPLGSWQFTAMVLRWSPDSRTLAFTWNATEIRELDASATDGNLLARSGKLVPIGTVIFSASTLTCNATQGWSLTDQLTGVEGGRWAVCAGTWQATAKSTWSPAPGSAGKCPSGHEVTFDFPYVTSSSTFEGPPSVTECPSQARAGDGAYIGWASADGSTLIGSLVWNGHSEFGIFGSVNGFYFTPLPPLPVSIPHPSGTLAGTDAW
jgi:hypothetical protein